MKNTIKLNNGIEFTVNALVKKLKAIQQEIYKLQNASKGYTYNYNYHYSKAFDIENNRYNTYLKDLSSTILNNDEDLIIADQVVDMIREKYDLTPNAVADLLNANFRKFILSIVNDSYASHRAEDITKILTK